MHEQLGAVQVRTKIKSDPFQFVPTYEANLGPGGRPHAHGGSSLDAHQTTPGARPNHHLFQTSDVPS